MHHVEFANEKFILLVAAYQRSQEFGDWAKRWLGFLPPTQTVRVRVIPPSAWMKLLAEVKHEIRMRQIERLELN